MIYTQWNFVIKHDHYDKEVTTALRKKCLQSGVKSKTLATSTNSSTILSISFVGRYL